MAKKASPGHGTQILDAWVKDNCKHHLGSPSRQKHQKYPDLKQIRAEKGVGRPPKEVNRND